MKPYRLTQETARNEYTECRGCIRCNGNTSVHAAEFDRMIREAKAHAYNAAITRVTALNGGIKIPYNPYKPPKIEFEISTPCEPSPVQESLKELAQSLPFRKHEKNTK